MTKNTLLLSTEFDIEFVHWKAVLAETGKWYIYEVYDRILDDMTYIAFKHRTVKDNRRDYYRQVRPAPLYETDKSWFIEGDLDECIAWTKTI